MVYKSCLIHIHFRMHLHLTVLSYPFLLNFRTIKTLLLGNYIYLTIFFDCICLLTLFTFYFLNPFLTLIIENYLNNTNKTRIFFLYILYILNLFVIFYLLLVTFSLYFHLLFVYLLCTLFFFSFLFVSTSFSHSTVTFFA